MDGLQYHYPTRKSTDATGEDQIYRSKAIIHMTKGVVEEVTQELDGGMERVIFMTNQHIDSEKETFRVRVTKP